MNNYEITPAEIAVYAGDIHLSTIYRKGQLRDVIKIFVHPNHTAAIADKKVADDVALLMASY